MKKKLGLLFVVLILLSLLVTACGAKPEELTGADRDAVLQYSEAMTDNLLTALDANDFTAFSKDFGPDMTKALTSEAFTTLQTKVKNGVGTYVSREVKTVALIKDKGYAVSYSAKYTGDDAVVVTVSFSLDEPHQVIGFWMNSKKIK